jgi:hypothetical protein
MKKTLLAALTAFTANVQAVPVYYDGNEFLAASESLKVGYVMGIVDAHAALNEKVFCEPKDATSGHSRLL